MTYTKAPWGIRARKNAGGNYMINGDSVTDVASVFCPAWGYDAPKSDEEATANARLIAAAPELLEALEIAQKEMEAAAYNMTRNGYEATAQPVQCLRHAVSITAGAIAKARGQA